MPLRASQHSKGEGIAPPECWTFLICRNGPSSLLATTTPPITSEWPPRYFVVACTTRSAPSSRGRCRTGVAQVLSQAIRAPASRAIPEISRTSVIFRRGFEGVSTHNSLVLGRTAPPDLLRVRHVDEGGLYAPAGEKVPEDLPRPEVGVVRGDHVVAGGERLQYRHRGGHA